MKINSDLLITIGSNFILVNSFVLHLLSAGRVQIWEYLGGYPPVFSSLLDDFTYSVACALLCFYWEIQKIISQFLCII